MPFQFLKYLQPTHYFAIPNKKGEYIFPNIAEIQKDLIDIISIDNNYQSKIAKEYDASWQLIQKGYISKTTGLKDIKPLPIVDEYRFIRKYFSFVWVLYVLLVRLIMFHNPIIEIRSWLRTRKTKRIEVTKDPIPYQSWTAFQSDLLTKKPVVSIIIPTLNRYGYLKDVLKDLQVQDYKNFEVIIVDQSEPFNADFYKPFRLNLNIIYQKEKALWLARNTAINKSNGNYLLFFDDDSRVEPNWISNHLRCLNFFNADLSSGVSISKVGAKVPKNYSYFRISDQLDTGNVMIKKDVFKKTGLFDRQFEKQRMGDGEFGLRAYLYGFLNISNPYAKRLHLKVDSGGLRDMGSWDAFRTKNLLAPRPIPSVLYFFRRYFGSQRSKLALLRSVPISIMPYQFKKNKMMVLLGVFVSFLLSPILLYQVTKSWRLAKKKINEGPKIEQLSQH